MRVKKFEEELTRRGIAKESVFMTDNKGETIRLIDIDKNDIIWIKPDIFTNEFFMDIRTKDGDIKEFLVNDIVVSIAMEAVRQRVGQ